LWPNRQWNFAASALKQFLNLFFGPPIKEIETPGKAARMQEAMHDSSLPAAGNR
jgi:hypothetical protein